eukprot:CAMPEP_0185733124 /NCGR_PEP_ID=MMETSP1171-20130828/18475_1 /TAXON_ID=374046 /ORGANISM="Helicotheca tamensis, Strain CCMP826" /LENGTH=46 /DNA_ID= /DNA_START= /DNA_END= /DNA_ORIENTATION=
MTRMAAAYDAHKAMVEKDKVAGKKKKNGGDCGAKLPAKKKQKRQKS